MSAISIFDLDEPPESGCGPPAGDQDIDLLDDSDLGLEATDEQKQPADADNQLDAWEKRKRSILTKNRKQRWNQKLARAPPPDPERDGLDKVASCLFSSDILRGSVTASAEYLAISPYKVTSNMKTLVKWACDFTEIFSEKLVSNLLKACDGSSNPSFVEPYLFIRTRSYDETPIRLAATDGESKKEFQTCKVLVTQQRFAIVFASEVRNDSDTKFHGFTLEAQVPSHLQIIETNSAELIYKALVEATSKSYDPIVASRFKRMVDVAVTDDYTGNHGAERLLKHHRCINVNGDEDRANKVEIGSLHVLCDVHKLHSCSGAVFALVPEFGSGLIKSALALRTGGMRLFRQKLKEVIKQRLCVLQGSPPCFGHLDDLELEEGFSF